jgi:predicted Fe-Mo cluster-binding NifX family protein
MVDSHFGQAERVYIYASDGQTIKLIENRKVGDKIGGCGGSCGFRSKKESSEKPVGFIQKLVDKLIDVDAVVALRIGDSPRSLLNQKGIRSFTSMDSLDQAALAAAAKLKEINSGNQDKNPLYLATLA